MTDIKSLDINELKSYLKELGEPEFRAGQVFSWIHEKLVNDYSQMSNISKDLRTKLEEKSPLIKFETEDILVSKDGTKKYLFKMPKGDFIETVFMEYKHGCSVCVSTQVGCGMDCAFCASGKGGFVKNISAGGIVEQIYAIARMENKRINNLVFMGMGEPLVNYDNVIRAIRLLSDEAGQNISQRHMTVSTCGIVPGIKRLSEEKMGITLALSLHAPTQQKRESIMPIAKQYDLRSVIEACNEYRLKTGRRVTYEYCLLGGVNDTNKDVDELANLCKGSDSHVNIIPYHQVSDSRFKAPENPMGFKNKLEKKGINVTIRRDLGQDIDGACGQLRLKRSSI